MPSTPESRADPPNGRPQSETLDPAWLAERLPNRSAPALAADLGQLIKHGEIGIGVRLPPVRDLARHLRVSPATVSAAWQRLRARNVLTGGGRAGVVVSGSPVTPRPIRYESEGHYGHGLRHDLGLSVPDPLLLPDVQGALRAMAPVPALNTYERTPVVPNLAAALRDDWPYPPESLLVANGGYEALMLALHTFVQAGDHVLVEDPSPPRMLDIVESTGARLEFLTRDADGVLPSELARGLRLRPAAVIIQPSVHNPLGTRMTERRRDELAELCEASEVVVMEDDGLGCLVADPIHTLSARCSRSLFIRSFSKSHGPDLRLGALAGPEDLVAKVRAFRGYGSAWTSRILQEALATLLNDPQVAQSVRDAKEEYDRRRSVFAAALKARGIAVPRGEGLDLWLPVADERFAIITLAAHGIAATSGSRFTRDHTPAHIRVSTSRMQPEEVAPVADAMARAVRGGQRRSPGH